MEKNIEELTLLLLYLTSWEEEQLVYEKGENINKVSLKHSWKGYSFDALNELTDKGYLYEGKHKNKSVTLTKEGVRLAEQLKQKYFGK